MINILSRSSEMKKVDRRKSHVAQKSESKKEKKSNEDAQERAASADKAFATTRHTHRYFIPFVFFPSHHPCDADESELAGEHRTKKKRKIE